MAAHLTAAEAQTVQKDPPPVPSFEPPALDLKDLEDASSCFEANTFAIRHAVFDWRIDFDKKTIEGSCTLMTERCPGSQATKLTLDAHSAMTVASVTWRGVPLKYIQQTYCDFGDKLVIDMPDAFDEGDITLTYVTSGGPAATWLKPEQAGGAPFLYTMGQACLNRALFPCFDVPSQKMTWAATIKAKAEYRIVAAASKKGERVVDSWRITEFEMDLKVPSYLVALAVGVLEERRIGPRSCVYAHPSLIEAAQAEFRGVTEKYLKAGEELFGPYAWGRYDILVMPRAFAYGGMENPRLTFLSPTLLVGDGSLTDTVAHEIAHSWFGNLVTNASWAEFFLSEGFTTYAQRRITYVVDGAALTDLETRVGWRLLENEVNIAQEGGGLWSRLRVPITHGVDPDETYNDVPYEKGFALLCAMRDAVVDTSPLEFTEDQRRAALDPWLQSYVTAFAGKALYSEDMVAHFVQHHKRAALQIDFPRWLDGEGLPDYVLYTPAADPLIKECERAVALLQTSGQEVGMIWQTWSTYQRSYFLDALCNTAPEDNAAPPAELYAYCKKTGLSSSKNCELTMRWALLVLRDRLVLREEDVERHLNLSAKQKFVLPVFRALAALEPERAVNCLSKIGPGLDDAVRRKLDKLVEADPVVDLSQPGAFARLCSTHGIKGCPRC